MRIVKCWLCALFIILAVMGGGSTAAYAAEQEDWQTVNLTEVRLILERDNEWEDVISLENITVEATSDGHYRFNYNEFAEQLTFSERDWSCYQVDWVVWEDKEQLTVYDSGNDSFALDDGYFTFSFLPPDEIGDMPFDMYFYFEVQTYETKVMVVNNVNNQTATVICDYIYEGDKIKTRLSTTLFSKNNKNGFYYIFDTPGYMFSGNSNYTLESGFVDYYVYLSDSPGVTVVLEYVKPYVVFTAGDKEYRAEMTQNDTGYACTIMFETPIEMTADTWSKFQEAVNSQNIVQDFLFTEEEYRMFSAPFNEMFDIDESFRVDGIITSMPVAFIYHERGFKEKPISLDGIRFELPEDYTNTVEIVFTDEIFAERQPTTGENVNDWFEGVKDMLGNSYEWLKTLFFVIVGLIVLLAVLKLIGVIINAFRK